MLIKNTDNNQLSAFFTGDNSTMLGKVESLRIAVRKMESLESSIENNSTARYWASIFTGFSSAAAITGISAINPIIGAMAITVSVAGAVMTIGGSIVENSKVAPQADKVKRYRLAIKSEPLANWAAVWTFCGTELFIESLYEASCGVISEGGLVRSDNKNPMAAALDCLASYFGLPREQVIEQIRAIKQGQPVELPSRTIRDSFNANQSTVIQQPLPYQNTPQVIRDSSSTNGQREDVDFYGNAITIRDSLVNRANESVLGGCVILAAPGGGKTTFLGSALGRLKQQHGSNFKSLAVVVKKTDVDAFRGVFDKCLCVKSSAVTAAIEIIKFIDKSTDHTGCVSRLFIDDFLTAIKYFETSLKGKFIDPDNYSVFDNKKEAFECSPDCVPLYDHLLTLLNEYWLVGREYNSAVWVSSHSSNVQDLPFMGSASARSVGDMIFLAKNNKREFIELALSNNFLISDNARRAKLKAELDSINLSGDEPIILGNHNNWTLGIVPASVHQEYQSYRELWKTKTPTAVNVDAVAILERSYQLDAKSAENKSLSDLATKVLDILQNCDSDSMSFDSLRMSRKWERSYSMSKPLKADLEKALDELIKSSAVSTEENNRYYCP